MTRIIMLFATLAIGAVLAFVFPAEAAPRKADGFRNSEQVDVSAHRRRYRYYRHYRYYPRYRPYYYYGPRIYYGYYPYYYRPYRYYAPFPFGPWW